MIKVLIWAQHYDIVMIADSLVQTPPSFIFHVNYSIVFLLCVTLKCWEEPSILCVSVKSWGQGYCINTMELFFPYIVYVYLVSLIKNNINV